MSGGIECPWCGDLKTRVVDTRPVPEEGSVRRQRECAGCTARWVTYEIDGDRLALLKDVLNEKKQPLDSR